MADEANPPEFFEVVDKFLLVANDLSDEWPSARLSSAIMYAAAQYSAFHFRNFPAELRFTEDEAVLYYCEQFSAMFRENLRRLEQMPEE
jgi:hypothetical protein